MLDQEYYKCPVIEEKIKALNDVVVNEYSLKNDVDEF